MSFEEKSKRNIEIAEYAYEKEMYDIAVNRYYYSIYQSILHRLENQKIDIDIISSSENAHNKTITGFIEFMKNRSGKSGFRKVSNIKNSIKSLKDLRHKADYGESLISKDEMDIALRKFSEIETFLKSH